MVEINRKPEAQKPFCMKYC